MAAGFSATEKANYNSCFLLQFVIVITFLISLFTIITVQPRFWRSLLVKSQAGSQVMLLRIKSSYLDANQRLSLKCRYILKDLTSYENFLDCRSVHPEVFCEKGVFFSVKISQNSVLAKLQA